MTADPGVNSGRPPWSPTIKVVVSVLAVIAVALAFYRFRIVFVPLIIGAIMAFILQPAVNFLTRRLRIPRGLATALLYILVLAVLAPIGIVLAPIIGRQIAFLQTELVEFIQYVQSLSPDTTINVLGLELIVESLVAEITSGLTELISRTATESVNLVFNIAEVALLIVFTLLIGFYLTKDAGNAVEWVYGLVPPGYKDDARKLMREINAVWVAFFRGQLILALVVSVIIAILSAILGLPQPILLGVLGGLLEFLPSIGHTIWIIVAVIIALLEGSSTLPVSNLAFVFILILAHLAFTQFDLNFLIPRIIGRGVHLHPMVVIIGIIIGASVAGPLGIALAAPTIASVRIISRYMYAMIFDLDPFPMVGPPSAPRMEREQAWEREQEQLATDNVTARVINRLRQQASDETQTHSPQELIGDGSELE